MIPRESSRLNLTVQLDTEMADPSKRFSEYVTKMRRCGHWEETGAFSDHGAEIRHINSGESLWFHMHDGGNEINSSRNFATAASRLCGCKFIEPRGRKKSRKAVQSSGFNLDSAARANAQQGGRVSEVLERIWEVDIHLMTLNPIRDRNKVLILLRERLTLAKILEDGYQPVPELPAIK